MTLTFQNSNSDQTMYVALCKRTHMYLNTGMISARKWLDKKVSCLVFQKLTVSFRPVSELRK